MIITIYWLLLSRPEKMKEWQAPEVEFQGKGVVELLFLAHGQHPRFLILATKLHYPSEKPPPFTARCTGLQGEQEASRALHTLVATADPGGAQDSRLTTSLAGALLEPPRKLKIFTSVSPKICKRGTRKELHLDHWASQMTFCHICSILLPLFLSIHVFCDMHIFIHIHIFSWTL